MNLQIASRKRGVMKPMKRLAGATDKISRVSAAFRTTTTHVLSSILRPREHARPFSTHGLWQCAPYFTALKQIELCSFRLRHDPILILFHLVPWSLMDLDVCLDMHIRPADVRVILSDIHFCIH